MKNMKGKSCPFDDRICQEGYCDGCMIYLEYEEKLARRKK